MNFQTARKDSQFDNNWYQNNQLKISEFCELTWGVEILEKIGLLFQTVLKENV